MDLHQPLLGPSSGIPSTPPIATPPAQIGAPALPDAPAPARPVEVQNAVVQQIAAKEFRKVDVEHSESRIMVGLKVLWLGLRALASAIVVAVSSAAEGVMRERPEFSDKWRALKKIIMADPIGGKECDEIKNLVRDSYTRDNVGEVPNHIKVMNQINCALAAAIQCNGGNPIKLNEEQKKIINDALVKIQERMAEGKDVKNEVKKIQKAIKQSIPAAARDRFKTELSIARGKNAPEVLIKAFQLEGNQILRGAGRETFVEQTKKYSLTIGKDYLDKRKTGAQGDLRAQAFATLNGDPGLRVSALKKQTEYQGVTVNGHEHSLKDDKGKEAVVQRSGVWAVHSMGDKPNTSILGLQKKIRKLDEKIAKLQSQLDPDIAIEHMKTERIRKEIAGYKAERKMLHDLLVERRDLTVAQALPKVVASVQRMTKDPAALKIAIATKKFVHIEEGLLSGNEGAEEHMMEDMKGTVDYLQNNCNIVFDDQMPAGAEPKVEVAEDPNTKDPIITIRMPKPVGNQDVGKGVYSLVPIYFNTGVNSRAHTGQNPLQDEINAESLTKLHAHAAGVVKHLDPIVDAAAIQQIKTCLKAIEDHYARGASRSVIDLKGQELRIQLGQALKAGLGIFCKSGKDRTGGKVNHFLANALCDQRNPPKPHADEGMGGQIARERVASAAPQALVANADWQREGIRGKLNQGISFEITGLNHGDVGKGNLYAVNCFQRAGWPESMTPDASLCGSVDS